MSDIARKDSFLMIDSGEYDNYQVAGMFRVLKDFNPVNELHAHQPELLRGIEYADEMEIAAFFVKQGFLEKVEYSRFFLTYGDSPAYFTDDERYLGEPTQPRLRDTNKGLRGTDRDD